MVCTAVSASECIAAGIPCVPVRTAIPDCASGLLGRSRATHLVRPIRIHARPDSRHDDWLVDRTESVLFHGWLAVRQTFAVGVLGPGCGDWTECSYQKPDRHRVSLCNHRCVSADCGGFVPSAEDAARFEHDDFSCGGGAMAHSYGAAKYSRGPSQGLPVVLLRQ